MILSRPLSEGAADQRLVAEAQNASKAPADGNGAKGGHG
jgi:hypothetical protein